MFDADPAAAFRSTDDPPTGAACAVSMARLSANAPAAAPSRQADRRNTESIGQRNHDVRRGYDDGETQRIEVA